MKKRIKILNYLLILLILLSPLKVNAAISGNYTISSNSSVEIGNTISITFKISAKKLFYWQAYITYDTNKLQLVSGSTNFQGESDNINGQSSVSKTLKFKAKKTGSAWVSINQSGDNNITSDGVDISFKKVTKYITVKEKTVIKYSSNNYLKSLSIDNYKISPTFDKNTLQYKVELPANTTNINIKATKEDSNSSISGIGKIKVNEGINKITVKVTAQNGNERKYTLLATVKELDPIEVIIDGKKYNIVRKQSELPKPSDMYIPTTIDIDNQSIPAYKNSQTNYTLIGLKDSDGNIKLYICGEEKNIYKEYNELFFNRLTIYPLNEKLDLGKEYKQTITKIDNLEVNVYKKSNNSQYSIFLGMNIETGEKHIYMYDSQENTVQRFDKSNFESKSIINNNSNSIYFYTTIILTTILILTYTIILTTLIKNNKKPKMIKLKYNKKSK